MPVLWTPTFADEDISMKDTGKRPDRMVLRNSSSASMFEKVLRAFAEGDLHYADVQLDLRRLLGGGAPPEELLEVLQRWELIEPLPDYAHEGILRHLNEAIDLAAEQNAEADSAPEQDPEADSSETETALPAAAGTTAREPALSAAGARTGALGADLAAARSALELEQSKNREFHQALAGRMAADEAARSRGERLERDSERYQAELHTLRDSLAARDRMIEQARQTIGERDTQLAALQREYAKMVPELESRMKTGAQQEAELQASRAGIEALSKDLAAARAAMESERGKAQEIVRALAEKTAQSEAVLSQREEAQRESERYRGELRTVRDSLAARDKSLAQVRHSLGERDAQLSALQQEQAKTAAALEARAGKAESELRAARARIEAVTLELKASHEAAAALRAQRDRGDSHLIAARTELNAVQARSSSLFEVLQTHEWRRGYDQNRFREADAQDAAESPTLVRPRQPEPAVKAASLDARQPEPAAKAASLDTRQPAPSAPPQSERAVRVAASPITEPVAQIARAPSKPSPSKQGGPAKPGWNIRAVPPRAMAIGAAILVLGLVAWFVAHRAPTPAKAPAVSAAAAGAAGPKPGTVIRDCPTCPAMTVVPAGRFKQGSSDADGGSEFAKPLHWVVISRPFAMSTGAVTLDEFRAFITATGWNMQGCDIYDGEWKHRPESSWENPGFVQAGSHPVTCTSWDDAKVYAAWLSAQTGHRYRLPSASEWEYAARAGGEAAQPWNADGSGACANANVADESAAHRYPGWTVFPCNDGYIYTAPSGSFKASAFGLSDMLGNVFQWTEDCWYADYKGAPIDGSARTGGDCSEHELRGGSWFSTPAYVRADYRNHFAANYRTSSVGIRLVRDLAP
jgi:formylglycine-generating enzyme required for sulfatase activity